MTQKQKKALLIFSSLLFMCAVFVIYVRTADLFGNYIPAEGYYKKVTVLTRAGNYVLAIGALFCPLFSFATMKKLPRVPENRGIAFLFSNAALAVTLLGTAVTIAIKALLGGIGLPNTNTFATALLFGLFSAVGCVFFVSNVFLRRTDVKLSTVFCVFVSLAFVSYMMYLYYEPAVHLNSPVKLVRQMSLVALSLFFINEAAFGVGKKYSEAYVGFGLAGAFLSLCDSLPNLAFGIVTGVPPTNDYSFLSDLLILSAFVYIIVRLTSVSQSRPEMAKQFMQDIVRKADEIDRDDDAEDDTERLILEFSGGIQTSLFDESSEEENAKDEEKLAAAEDDVITEEASEEITE